MALTSKVYEARDMGDFMEMVYERGWTDGLPVFPPTDNKVTAMIDYLGRAPGEVISVVPPGEGIAPIENKWGVAQEAPNEILTSHVRPCVGSSEIDLKSKGV